MIHRYTADTLMAVFVWFPWCSYQVMIHRYTADTLMAVFVWFPCCSYQVIIHRYIADTLMAVFVWFPWCSYQVIIHRYIADTLMAVFVWFTWCRLGIGDDPHILCWHTLAVFDWPDADVQAVIHRYTAATLVQYVCVTGDLEGGPALVHKSGDECVYQFEWYTAAACPMSHQYGKDCTVVDTQAGQLYSCVFSDVKRKREGQRESKHVNGKKKWWEIFYTYCYFSLSTGIDSFSQLVEDVSWWYCMPLCCHDSEFYLCFWFDGLCSDREVI